jgi:hypothetical protein
MVVVFDDDAWVVGIFTGAELELEADGGGLVPAGGTGTWTRGCGAAAGWALGGRGAAAPAGARGDVGCKTVVRQIGPARLIFYIRRKTSFNKTYKFVVVETTSANNFYEIYVDM